MTEIDPAGFASYAHADNDQDEQRITEIISRLEGEVQVQTGREFRIFVDRDDIAVGQQWKARIDDSLNEVTFLIPFLTPSFFTSGECRREVERFLEREQDVGRDDLILAVYYIDVPVLNDESKRSSDPLAEEFASRQYHDWRDLRFEPLQSATVGKRLEEAALQIRAAIDRAVPTTVKKRKTRSAVPTVSEDDGHVSSASAAIDTSAASYPVDRAEPPTRIVNQWGRGDHATLVEAVETASPGDRIIVDPGLYDGGIVIDKPLEILGRGARDEIVVRSTDTDAVLFKANIGRISKLDFYALSRHADVLAAFRDPINYSNKYGVSLEQDVKEARAVMSFLGMDPPEHTRIRIYALSRHADVLAAFRDQINYSNKYRRSS